MEKQSDKEKEVIEATRLIGKNNLCIRRMPKLKAVMANALLKTMMVKPGNSKKDEQGRAIATTRTRHYANTGYIALEIARGLFPKDEDFAKGVAVAALLHDLGQWPFGHDGDEAAKYASKEYNGGPRLHNIEGMDKFRFRYAQDVIDVINSGRIIMEECKKRNIAEEELKERLNIGLEPEIEQKIQKETEKNGDLPNKAIEVICMSIANHNGERGTANIEPDYNRTFEEFITDSQKTYFDAREDKNMVSCNIVDAIVKISDQISSIPFDIIDAKRAGIEDEIYEGWADPISKVLKISTEDAIKKLKGNNKQLYKLARNLQEELIKSVIRSSTKQKIGMDLSSLLYGVTNQSGEIITPGLRTFNMSEHISYASSAEMEVYLNNIMSGLTDKLSKKILDENGIFYPELNEIFRISSNKPLRNLKEQSLIKDMNKNDNLEDFYSYIVKTSAEEYKYNKEIVRKREIQYFGDIIKTAIENRENIINGNENRSPRNSTGYLIEEYILSPDYEAIIPDENNNYSDGQIKDMIDRINTFLATKHTNGTSHLSLLVDKHNYILQETEGTKEVQKITIGKRRLNTDQQIAARLVISYLNTLNDRELIDLAEQFELINDEEKEEFTKPYSSDNKAPHRTKASKIAAKNYENSNNEEYKGEEK